MTCQQRIALHRITVIGQRHAALAQDAKLITHILVLLIAQTLKQSTDRGFRHATEPRQLGAVVADQVIEVVKHEVGNTLLLRRELGIVTSESFIKLFHKASCNFCFSRS